MLRLASMRKNEEGMMIASINLRVDELLASMNKEMIWIWLLSLDEEEGAGRDG